MSEADFAVLQRQFAQQIRQPQDNILPEYDQRRMAVYQDLFYNNLEGFLAGCYPVLKEILTGNNRWEVLTRDFMARHACTTPYFLQICEEFLIYLERNDLPLALPDYSRDLAHWEWMELFADISVAQDNPAVFNAELPDAVVQITALAWLCQYTYPVHQISAQYAEPQPADTYLLVHRHADKVSFVVLNPLSALLFQALQQNSQQQSCSQILRNIAEQTGLDAERVINGGLQILDQWKAVGIVLGSY